MPMVVRIARELYSLRLEELKRAIHEDEEKFLILVSEIDDIRAGKWDNQLLGLPDIPSKDVTALQEKPVDTIKEDNNEIVLKEEQEKIKADNFENEARNVRDRDITPDMSGMPTIDTPPQNIEFNPVQSNEKEEKNYDTYTIDQETHPLKNRIDDKETTDLPALKRQKTEDMPTTIYQGKVIFI